MAKLTSEVELTCPCCDAVLVVDLNLGRIVGHREAPRADMPELDNAARILHGLFEQSVQAEKGRGDALSRRFEEALKQANQEPVSKPTRAFDLD
jgi:hypothetical protein